ncbi:MAG: hypothetical protein AB1427_21575, partial [Thermodesulfobacteriota bacterium]
VSVPAIHPGAHSAFRSGGGMPVKINMIDGGMGIEFISSGVVTGKEIIEANKKIYTREYLERLKYKIIDRSECTEYQVTTKEMRIIADQDIEASKINKHITILLISPTVLQYGMTRMWQVLSEETGFESIIFKDRPSANEYINKKFKAIPNET